MKTSKILLQIILPITIATLFLVGFFFTQKLFPEPALKACEKCFPSNSVYLTYFFAILIISSLYQIIIGNWIIEKNQNRFALKALNITVFASFFTLAFLIINLFEEKRGIEWEFFPFIFLAILFWGLLITVLMKICEKIFGSNSREHKL